MDEDRWVDGILIGGYLTIIILRIFNVIQWNWFWILCPFWLIIGGTLVGLIAGLIISIPIIIIKKIRGIKNERY